MQLHKRPTLTPFQRRVYVVVRRIPTGEVRSYQWVARQLGNPKLARAVGQALHRNPCLRRACDCPTRRRGRQAWPSHVPCHRVIRADGSLGGYAWGITAKRRRLEAERRALRRARQAGSSPSLADSSARQVYLTRYA